MICNWCCYGGANLCGVSRFQYPPHIRIIRVMCSGRVDPQFILDAFAKGAEEYLGNDFAPGEGEDPYCRQLFGETLPVSSGYTLYRGDNSPSFAELAFRIFTPMLNHMEEL